MQTTRIGGKIKDRVYARHALIGSICATAIFLLAFLVVPYVIVEANATNVVGATVPWNAVTLTLDTDYGNGSVGDEGHGDVNFGAITPSENSGTSKGTMRVVKKTIRVTTDGTHYAVYLTMAGSTNALAISSDSNVNIPAIAGTWTTPAAFTDAGWGYAVPTGVAQEKYATNFGAPAIYAGYDSLVGQDLTVSGTGSSVYNTGTWAAVQVKGTVTEPIWSSEINGSDTFPVYYAAMVDTDIMAGEYSNTIEYTAIASSQALDTVSNNLSRNVYLVGQDTVETLSLDLTASTIDFAREKTTVYLVPHSVVAAANYTVTAEMQTAATNGTYKTCAIGQGADDFKFENRGLKINCTMPANEVEGKADGAGAYDIWVSVADYGYNYISKYVDASNAPVATVVYAGLQSTKDAEGTQPYVSTMQGMTSQVCKNTNMWGNATSYNAATEAIDYTNVKLYDFSGTNEITVFDTTGIADQIGTFSLEDNRDNKTYLVRRFADGNCWMVQNLDLDLAYFAGTESLTPANTDISYGLTSTDPGYRSSWNPSASALEDYETFAAWSSDHLGASQAYQFQPQGTSGTGYRWGSLYNENVECTTTGEEGSETTTCTRVFDMENRAKKALLDGTDLVAIDATTNRPNNRSFMYQSDGTYVGRNETATLNGSVWVENNSLAAIPRSYDNGSDWIDNSNPAADGASSLYKSSGTPTSPSWYMGDWYNWYAATAESGTWDMKTESVAGSATDSICPKGWQLPVNGAANDKSWGKLLTGTYKLADGTTAINSSANGSRALRSFPLSIVFSGYYYWVNGGLSSRGTYGYYWSSTPYALTRAHYLNFNSTGVNPQNGYNKTFGLAVRCVAR